MSILPPNVTHSIESTSDPQEYHQKDTAWEPTTQKILNSVVSIYLSRPHGFDTDRATTIEATAFVVDAKQGLILTNRHVSGTGPFLAYCTFTNQEECDLSLCYTDPVHDYSYLRFDPKAIKYAKLSALELRPDLAKVGLDIRVVGNDAGEKLSILSGVISRVERNAPEYGIGYSDFNTNYIQSAVGTRGGSSGSPVVSRNGFAVALQAGGRADGAATNYSLPLDRPLRTLKLIQRGEHVSRGTIQTQWISEAFNKCQRLGLSADVEEAIRDQFPNDTGMLVAKTVLPQGPASDNIKPGDILIEINGRYLTQFVLLDDILDDYVGRSISIKIQRAGKNMQFELQVGNLHNITPNRFVSVAGGVFHDLSYILARRYGLSRKDSGVFLSEPGGSFTFASAGQLIQQVDNQPTPDLNTFIKVMEQIPDRKRVEITSVHLLDLSNTRTHIVPVDRHWHPNMKEGKRNDVTGRWVFKSIASPVPAVQPESTHAKFVEMHSQYQNANKLIRNFVRVHVSMPIKLDGIVTSQNIGGGFVVDPKQGLVIVSRAVLPHALCDISLTIADSISVDAKVIFMHPLHNYAFVTYDVSLVKAPLSTPKFATEFIKKGNDTIFVGVDSHLRPSIAKTVVTGIATFVTPATSTTPRYRATNFDAITFDTNLGSSSESGVLIDEDGSVQAMWLSFLVMRQGREQTLRSGLAAPILSPVLEKTNRGETTKLRIFNFEMYAITMSDARVMGVPEIWIQKVEQTDSERHQLFKVKKVHSRDGNGMHEGDILLTLDTKLIIRSSDLDVMYHNHVLVATVVRKHKEETIEVSTVATEDLETDHLLTFCGATLQCPHQAVLQKIGKPPSEVYISSQASGSPSQRYGVSVLHAILSISSIHIT
jgi:S1-C subfamily serine protease